MTSRFLVLLLACLLYVGAGAQRLSGTIVDAETSAGIPYASVALQGANVGTTAARNGTFQLSAPALQPGDSLLISNVGYGPQRLALQAGIANYTIRLRRAPALLRTIGLRRYDRTQLLPWEPDNEDYLQVSSGTMPQLARTLTAPGPYCRVEEVRIATGHDGFGSNRKSRFRLHIYDYDSVLQQPGAELCDSLIEVWGRGVIRVPLREGNIILPGARFCVAVQWLELEENKGPDFKSPSGTVVTKSFYPAVRMRRTSVEASTTWFQAWNGRWHRFDAEAAITAVVAY